MPSLTMKPASAAHRARRTQIVTEAVVSAYIQEISQIDRPRRHSRLTEEAHREVMEAEVRPRRLALLRAAEALTPG